MPDVRWILPRRGVSVVRSFNVDLCSMSRDPMDLFHRSRNRLDILDNMNDTDTIKTVVRKRVGKLVQVMNNIDAFQRSDVQTNASRPFVFPTTNIEDLKTQSQFPPVASKAQTALDCIEIKPQCKMQPLPRMRRDKGRLLKRGLHK